MTKKLSKETVEKRSISAPPEIFESADTKMKACMISSFSEYVRGLIRRDVEGKETVESKGGA